MIPHVVLLGDSIFDNARYVPDRPPVIEQLRRCLPSNWNASLLAKDGQIAEDVVQQLTRLPSDATHLVISVGGNDALGESIVLNESACSVGDALGLLHDVRSRFRRSYRTMLEALSTAGRPTAVCTIYNTVPALGPADQVALALFNEIILHEAFHVGLPVIDLRLVCDRASDFSHISSIEPSMLGGLKIARVIAEVVTKHSFGERRSIIYA